jgi:hypothetical protein
MPLALTDSELMELMNLSAPFTAELRDPFLRAVATELSRYKADELGPSLISVNSSRCRPRASLPSRRIATARPRGDAKSRRQSLPQAPSEMYPWCIQRVFRVHAFLLSH